MARNSLEEAIWLAKNPAFEEKPASMEEFLGDGYLQIYSKVRPGVRRALIDIFGEEVQTERIAKCEKAMFTGAIGVGKTTLASIALAYMAHWVLCLRDPQDFFNLLPGSRIAIMEMSTSRKQALDVIFGDIKARIQYSPWFTENYPYDSEYKNVLKFSKDIWILPGDSTETTFEGYNILAGILDEMDSHKQTTDKDYADVGYTTIEGRISSRFDDRGLLLLIGQMKKANGFAAAKYAEFLQNPDYVTVHMKLWESFGWDKYTNEAGERDSFYYDPKRRTILPKSVGDLITESDSLLEVPNLYLNNFQNAPEKALRDLAGVPPATDDPFISLVDRVEDCRDRWIARFGGPLGYDEDEIKADPSLLSPVSDSPTRPQFRAWFTNKIRSDPRLRAAHVDIGYSEHGDSLGLAMGHVEEIITTDNDEIKPLIVIDFLMRIKAAEGNEVMLYEVRSILYHLRDDLGFRLKRVTYDGFESTDTIQLLRKKRFEADKMSVDKSTLPYQDLREAIYERRLEFPPYYTYKNRGDAKRWEPLIQELIELQDTGKKIDHPVGGSKDLSDAVAGVVTTLMGDRRWRRGVSSLEVHRQKKLEKTGTEGNGFWTPRDPRDAGELKAPLPPALGSSGSISIPRHLRPNPPRRD
jgi:hypothetical protein